MIVDGYVCDKCDIMYDKRYAHIHKNDITCRIASQNLYIKRKGLSFIDDLKHIVAVKEANVEHEDFPISISTFVPEWVHEAISLYDQNKSIDDMYAGLTLTEFLKRVKHE
jgi:hypothetical protein